MRNIYIGLAILIAGFASLQTIGTARAGVVYGRPNLPPQAIVPKAGLTTTNYVMPLKLVVDPAETQWSNGQEVLQVSACVLDGNNNPVFILGGNFAFQLDTNGTAYPMAPTLVNPTGSTITPGGPAVGGKLVPTGCMTGKMISGPCLPGGVRVLTVQGTAPGNIALTGTSRATFDKVQPTITLVNIPASAELGTAVTILGTLSTPCKSPGISITSGALGKPIDASVSGTNWTAAVSFDKAVFAGPVVVTASAPETAYSKAASASFRIQLTQPSYIATFINLPTYMNAGSMHDVRVTLVRASDRTPVPSVSLHVSFADWPACDGTTSGNGDFDCQMGPPANIDISKVGKPVAGMVALNGISGAKLDVVGAPRTAPLTREGWIIKTIPASKFVPQVQAHRPGGMLLNNYIGGMNDQDASHCASCSWQFFDTSLSAPNAKRFDIAYFHPVNGVPYYFYLNTILVKMDDIQFRAPANLVVPMEIAGYNGSPPAVIGKCWRNVMCGAVPSFTNLSLANSDVELQLAASNGKIAVSVASTVINLGFDCSNMIAAACPILHGLVNQAMQANMSSLLQDPRMTQQLAQITQQLNALVGFSVTSVVSVQITPQGDFIYEGPPTG